MCRFDTVNILDLIELVGEEKVNCILSDFSCPKNREIEIFVSRKAIEFAKKKMSVTYLVFDKEVRLAGIFTLTHKAIQISNEGLSKTAGKKMLRFSQLDESSNSYVLSAFLIAQFGKNSKYTGNAISGDELMDMAHEILFQVQKDIGGGVVYLECEEKQELLNFYKNEHNGFMVFDERFSSMENVKYIQLFKFI